MRLVLAAALLTVPLTASAMETRPAAEPALRNVEVQGEKACLDDLVHQARNRAGGGVSKLGELPPAEAYLAVHREVDGCLEPVLVREERSRPLQTPDRPSGAGPL